MEGPFAVEILFYCEFLGPFFEDLAFEVAVEVRDVFFYCAAAVEAVCLGG